MATKRDPDAYLCEGCDTLFKAEDIDTSDSVYECGECGTVFKRSESPNDSHQCECGKFASKLADFGCPDCNDEGMVPLYREE